MKMRIKSKPCFLVKTIIEVDIFYPGLCFMTKNRSSYSLITVEENDEDSSNENDDNNDMNNDQEPAHQNNNYENGSGSAEGTNCSLYLICIVMGRSHRQMNLPRSNQIISNFRGE